MISEKVSRSGTPSTRLNGSWMWMVTCWLPSPSAPAARCIIMAGVAGPSVGRESIVSTGGGAWPAGQWRRARRCVWSWRGWWWWRGEGWCWRVVFVAVGGVSPPPGGGGGGGGGAQFHGTDSLQGPLPDPPPQAGEGVITSASA